MDRIWAESQPDLLCWGADNTTNFSTVSAPRRRRWGQQRCRRHQMNSCCLHHCRTAKEESFSTAPHPPHAFCINAEEGMDKLRAGPVHITLILHLWSQWWNTIYTRTLGVDVWWNVHEVTHRVLYWLRFVAMEKQLAIMKMPLVGI